VATDVTATVSVALTIAFVAVACLAAAWDIRYRRIPNAVTVTGLALALVLRAVPGGETLAGGLLGAAIGLTLGIAFFALGAIGAGDAKLIAAFGAFLGPMPFLQALALGVVLGGVFALADAALRGLLPLLVQRSLQTIRGGFRGELAPPGMSSGESGRLRIPYGVPLALGAVIWRFQGGAILEGLTK
jgi:prepilin peptidase CpaA